MNANNHNNTVQFYVLFLQIGTHTPLQSKEPKHKVTSERVCASTLSLSLSLSLSVLLLLLLLLLLLIFIFTDAVFDYILL